MNRRLSVALENAITTLYDHPEMARLALGALPSIEDVECDEINPSGDLMERLRALDLKLESYVISMSAESDEYDDLEKKRLQSEGLGILLAIRELRGHVPELDAGAGAT